ncbi:MAG: hypothetical protein B6245_11895 [Desulfobacteraceae bacterium 4572_88]|nr:MAG: hypothetical protein B6245_11895 [Desulfobacteraceae bacterium 4572_88]
MLKLLEKIAESPWLNMVSGVVLLITSGNDIVKTFDTGNIGVHHGVAFFGLVQIIQCLLHILEGTKQVLVDNEHEDTEPSPNSGHHNKKEHE